MHRRARHLNPASAGAMFVLDARFIDQADNTAVNIWKDRSANAYNVSQGTAANQPTLQTGEVGGSSVVRFDGGDVLRRSDSGFPTGNFTFIGVSKQDNSLPSSNYAGIMMYGSTFGGQGILIMYATDGNAGNNAFCLSQYGNGMGVSDSTGRYNVTTGARITSTYYARVNGGPTSSKAMGTATVLYGADGLHIGAASFAQPTAQNFLTGDIGCIAFFSIILSDSLLKRIEHSGAFSFKLACA